MKIFLSWSKNKSRLLAETTKKFIENVLGHSIEFFFSPEMYKGTRVDHEIHNNLLNSEKCFVCITADNFKNPWLLYEAGVVFGVNHSKTNKGIVIPILFEHIPDWSSWIDKPLNQYVPIQMQNSNKEYACGKRDFKNFLIELSEETGAKLKNFNKYWNDYENTVKAILAREQLIPDTCKHLVDQILERDEGNFSIVSPEITKEHIVFHRGFSTTALTRILLNNVIDYQGKRLWFFGRRNKRLLTSENNDFFKYLADEGLNNGVDFRCLFPYPNTEATYKATCKEKERSFYTDLQTCMEKAIMLKKQFNLPTEKLFRLYQFHRSDSIIISDNAAIHRTIICDGQGYPLPYTNSEFEILDISDNSIQISRGRTLYNAFEIAWDQSVPLTKEVYNLIYN